MSHTESDSRPFELLAGHVVLDFANTLDDRFVPGGPHDLLPTYDRLLAFCLQSGVLAPPEAARLGRDSGSRQADEALKEATSLRDAVYDVIIAHLHKVDPPAAALHTLNEVLARAHCVPVIDYNRSRFAWRDRSPVLDVMTPVWRLGAAAAALLTSSDLDYIRECGAATCRWLFLDRSRNHSRRWCDMKICGNRRKAARFRAGRHGHDRRSSDSSRSIPPRAAKNSLRT